MLFEIEKKLFSNKWHFIDWKPYCLYMQLCRIIASDKNICTTAKIVISGNSSVPLRFRETEQYEFANYALLPYCKYFERITND